MSSSRRITRAALGGTTLLVLVVALAIIGRPDAEATLVAETVPTIATTTQPTNPATAPTTTAQPTTTVPPTTRPPTTVTTIPTTTTTTIPPLVLESDGLGVVDFGATVEETVEAINERLGGADSDSGWVNSRGTFGTCPGSVVRVIRWASLRAFFGDGPTAFGETDRHFFYYSQSSAETDTVIDLRTRSGIAIGDTVEQLEDAYGDDLVVESTGPFGVTFTIETGDPGLLAGTLTESVASGQATSIGGGFGCGA